MATSTMQSRVAKRNPINTILAIILIIETIFVAGVLGYRMGEAHAMKTLEDQQPIYNITLQVDPSMIEYVEPETDILEESEPVVEPEVKDEPVTIKHIYTEEDVTYLAKTVYGEARGLSKTEQAAVVWTILNRVDNTEFNQNTIISVITAPSQFSGYKTSHPVDPEIRELVIDVLDRWAREKAGETNIGRVLPKEYVFFVGNGVRNMFSKEWRSENYWDWSLESPYN